MAKEPTAPEPAAPEPIKEQWPTSGGTYHRNPDDGSIQPDPSNQTEKENP